MEILRARVCVCGVSMCMRQGKARSGGALAWVSGRCSYRLSSVCVCVCVCVCLWGECHIIEEDLHGSTGRVL